MDQSEINSITSVRSANGVEIVCILCLCEPFVCVSRLNIVLNTTRYYIELFIPRAVLNSIEAEHTLNGLLDTCHVYS